MLYTNLKHLENSKEHALAIHENDQVMVICGRMEYGCISVYRIAEELEKSYPHVKFFDMDFDNPESQVIRSMPQLIDSHFPFVICYKEGNVVEIAKGLQTEEAMKSMLDRQFSSMQILKNITYGNNINDNRRSDTFYLYHS